MARDIVQSLWVKGPLSEMEKLCIRSFVANGHPFILYTYDNPRTFSVPDGALVVDANDIIPKEMLFTVRDGHSSFSDFFRWALINKYGGWWVDTDTVCLRPFDFPSEYVFVGGLGAPGSDDCVSSGMFKAPKGSPITEWAWEQCQRMDPETMPWGEAGPPLITKAVHRFNLTNHIISGNLFFPVFYTEAPRAFIDTYVPRIAKDCYSVHLFNEMWRLAKADKNAKYPETSLYEQLKRRFS
jgi:hypothetical protein